MQVLVVSDQQETESLWIYCLKQRSVRATAMKFDADAKAVVSPSVYELLVLDINDSGKRALPVCRYARASFAGPILLFTYEYDERFHLEAYRAGVDESIAKPIGITLAIAKVDAWLRRAASGSSEHFHEEAFQNISQPVSEIKESGELHNFHIDPRHRLVTTPEGKVTRLSKLECRLLSFLSMNPGEVVPSHSVIAQVWAGNSTMDIARLKNLVYRLRRKIEPEPDHPRYLCTAPGYGYRFDAVISK